MERKWGLLFLALVCASAFADHAADELRCDLYPIAVDSALFENAVADQQFIEVETGTGPGNFNFLSWNGENDTPTLAASLAAPGNAETYLKQNSFQGKTCPLESTLFLSGMGSYHQ